MLSALTYTGSTSVVSVCKLNPFNGLPSAWLSLVVLSMQGLLT
jgi:hypothetical protein